jgi:outer membrane lipoprotein-sorting protein
MLKGKMFRIDLGAQKIFSDGKSLYTHLVEEKELQISTLEESEDEISPSNIFTFYQKGFNYTFLEEKIENGRTVQYIDLTPVKKQVSYFKIRLCVDKATSHITTAKIFDKNGSRYTYSVSKLVPNPKVADNLFVYNQVNFKGVDVVDLR